VKKNDSGGERSLGKVRASKKHLSQEKEKGGSGLRFS